MRDANQTYPIVWPESDTSTDGIGARSWFRRPDGTIQVGGVREDATEDKPDPSLDDCPYPRVTAVEEWGAIRGVVRDKQEEFEPGPLGFRYQCPVTSVTHFVSTRYPLPRIVRCDHGASVVVDPPDESIDTHDWDDAGRYGLRWPEE